MAGDPEVSYTETHQVLINVGYSRGTEVARRLEENNIIVNYQAAPDEEAFTAAGSLRMGVAEMTRFGMEEKDFETVAQFICDVLKDGKNIKNEVKLFRKNFVDLRFCFTGDMYIELIKELHNLI